MATYKLGELHKWIAKAEERAKATIRDAVLQTADEANTPRQAGGRIPVFTGFLYNSIVAAESRMPSGESEPGEGVRVGEPSIAAQVRRWNPLKGAPFYVGWAASYARPMEYRYGFMRGATENWDQQVERAARTAKQRIK